MYIFLRIQFVQNMLRRKVSATGLIPRSRKFTNPLCKKIARFNPTLSTNCTKWISCLLSQIAIAARWQRSQFQSAHKASISVHWHAAALHNCIRSDRLYIKSVTNWPFQFANGDRYSRRRAPIDGIRSLVCCSGMTAASHRIHTENRVLWLPFATGLSFHCCSNKRVSSKLFCCIILSRPLNDVIESHCRLIWPFFCERN